MAYGFLETATTPAVAAAQASHGSADYWARFSGDRASDRFTDTEAEFIAKRDSFYIATTSETGWPYVQHRGGPPGFLTLLDDRTLALADFRGNRQYITLGNLSADGRAALFLMDYPGRRRLKIYAYVESKSLDADVGLTTRLVPESYRAKPERLLILHLHAFDWNCPQHITPRFTQAELSAALDPVQRRLRALEMENIELRARIEVTRP